MEGHFFYLISMVFSSLFMINHMLPKSPLILKIVVSCLEDKYISKIYILQGEKSKLQNKKNAARCKACRISLYKYCSESS